MNRSAIGGQGRVCEMKTKAFSFTHRTKVTAGGTVRENDDVTSGEQAESPVGAGGSGPISESEVASKALSVGGRLNTTDEAW